MTTPRISELERSAWSMFSFMGCGPGGHIVGTPIRLVIKTPVARRVKVNQVIDPGIFASVDWQLVDAGGPVVVIP